MIVISDTSPISGLFLIGQLELLPQLFGTVIIPQTVAEELGQLSLFGHDTNNLLSRDWLSILQVSNFAKLETLRHQLDPGEAEAIALAQELNADFLLIDEVKGRQIAVTEGLHIIGVLGILLQAKQVGLIQNIQLLMDELRLKARFRISPALYHAVLLEAGEA